MPDYRVLKRSLLDDPRFGLLPLTAQDLYFRLHLLADDQGRLQGHPLWIRSRAYTYQDVSPQDIEEALSHLEQAGIIIRYEDSGLPLIQIATWWQHQDNMQWAAPSVYPPPAGWKDRLRYRKGGRVITRNWGQPPSASEPSPAPESDLEALQSPEDTPTQEAPSGKPSDERLGKDSGEPLGRSLGKPLPEDLGKRTNRVRVRKDLDQTGPDKTTTTATTPQELKGVKAGGGGGGGSPPEQTAEICRLAGIPPETVPPNARPEDVLAALASAYADPGVKTPALVVPHRLRTGVGVEFYDPEVWREHLPQRLLAALGLSSDAEPPPPHPPPSPPPEIAPVWQAILGQLAQDVPKAAFEAWVKPAVPVAYENGGDTARVILAVANDYAQRWLQERLGTVLEQRFRGALGKPTTVQIVVAPV